MKSTQINEVKQNEIPRELHLQNASGEDIGEHLLIIGKNSSPARAVIAQSKAAIADSEDAKERSKILQEVDRKLVLSMVVGWSFEDEFSHESLCAFIDSNPSIYDSIVTFSSDGRNFEKKPEASSDTVKNTSRS